MTAPPRRAWPSLGVIVTTVALATSVVALLFTLRPELAPDPRTRVAAAVKSLAIDPHVSRAQFFAAVEPDDQGRRSKLEDAFLAGVVNAADPSRAQIRAARRQGALNKQRGSIVYIATQGQGLKHKRVTLYWFVYDATTRRRMYGGGSDEATLTAPDDQFVVPTFVDEPVPCRTRIFVRMELRNEQRTLLAVGATKSFRSCPRRS